MRGRALLFTKCASFLALVLLLCLEARCQRKPPESDASFGQVAHRSYTIPVTGYRQSVTMRCAPEEITELLENPDDDLSGYFTPGLESEGERQDQPEGLGSSAPLTIKVVGLEIPGRLIVIRAVQYRQLARELMNYE